MTIAGIGLSSSATSEEKIVTNLAMKLQIPIPVAFLKNGNRISPNEAWYAI